VPSPIAHSLAGVAVAHVARQSRWIGAHWAWFALLVFVANAPDLDFLWFHHGPVHSLTAAVLAGVAAGLIARVAGASVPYRVGLLVGAAYLSHVLLDFMNKQPPGAASNLTLFWPFSNAYIPAPIQLFEVIRHRSKTTTFFEGLWQWKNVKSLFHELIVIAGFALLFMIGSRVRRVGGRAAGQR
jgi:hypothetical protein